MKKTQLIIDAGHGSCHPVTGQYLTEDRIGKKTLHTDGKYHRNGWFYEGYFNRLSAWDFIDQATTLFKCYMVTDPYRDTSLSERVARADEYYKMIGGAPALCLSFHANSNSSNTAPQTGAWGYTLHTYSLTGTAADIAKKIAPGMNQVFGELGSLRPQNHPLHFQRRVAMTVETDMPCIILEQGFFDNPNDAKILLKPENIRKMNARLLYELDRVLS